MSDDTRREAVEAAAKALGQFQVTETACWGAQTCKLDPDCADYEYQCKAQADRETQIRADERRKVTEEIAQAIQNRCRQCEESDDPTLAAECEYRDAAAIARQVGGGQ